jgi:predicted phage tail protein
LSAVNSAGEGACAPPASATTFSVPTQPQANAATASSTTTIQQTWSYPASDGGSPVATYRVYRGLNSAMTCDNSSLVGVTSEPTRTFNHTGLSPGGTYYVRVSAVNSVGEGACAPPASATTGSAPAGASPPTQPQGNAASATSGTTIHETWTDPASNGGATVTAFNVYRGATSAMVCDGTTFIASVTASTHAYEHAGLSPGSTYYVRVSAVNAAGEGACAPPASATTFSAPTQPQANNAVAVSASAVNQSWSYPASDGGSPVASYRVFRGTSTAMTCDNTTFVATVTEPTRYYLHTGLAASTTIYVRVSAVNGVGEGACAPPASATTQSSVGTATPPSQPQSNAATANGTTIQQAWTAPANSGGATITAYNVYRGTSSAMPCDGTTFVASVSGTTFAYSHVGLASQVTYYVRVSAVNSAGEGTCAPPASATTASPPTQPLNLTANVTGANLTLAWSAPASDGGSQLQGYDLYVGFDATMSCDASTRVASSVALTNRTWTFANLPNGSYFARASAVNGVGEGACSATTTATITSGGIEATSLGGASGSSGGGSVWALLGAVFALVLAVAGIETILRLAAWIRGP